MAEASAMGAEPNARQSMPLQSHVSSQGTNRDITKTLQSLETVSTDLMNLNNSRKLQKPRPRKVKNFSNKKSVDEVSESLKLMNMQPLPPELTIPDNFNQYAQPGQRPSTSGPVRRQKVPVRYPVRREDVPNRPQVGNDGSIPNKSASVFLANMIVRLKKKSAKHPHAEFMCKVCLYYCDSVAVVEKHISDKRHKESLKEHTNMCTITHLPESTPEQLAFLTVIVDKEAKSYGLTYEDRTKRQTIVDHINEIMKEQLPGCSVRLYGSSLHCLGLKSSDVNIDFVVPTDQPPSKLLLCLRDLIEGNDSYSSVVCDLNADLPGIQFKDKDSELNCLICLSNKNAYEISKLLAAYEGIDSRMRTVAVVFRLWASFCRIDKVMLGCLPTYAFDILLVYFMQQTEKPILPVLHELVDNPNPDTPEHYLDPSKLQGKWKSENKMSVGAIWLELLKFYARDFALTERVVCVRQLAPLKRSAKKWPGRKIAIEDPFLQKRNVSRSIVNIITFDYILHCFRCTFKYFGILQTKAGPIFGTLQLQCSREEMEEGAIQSNNNSQIQSILEMDSIYSSESQSGQPRNYEYLVISPENAALLFKKFNFEYLHYQFNRVAFTNNKVLPVVCCVCQQEGHVKEKCKAEKLPPLLPLPPMNDTFIGHISQLCQETYRTLLPTNEEISQRETIVKEIQEYMITYNPKARLELFGSSCNGFGLHKSDLDICLTFIDNKTGESLNHSVIIEDLVTKLRKYDKLGNVLAITTAKVPIVKFVHIQSKLEGDISVYNTLAQRNTKMLRAYSEIDIRVKILGFMFKRFAKLCDICDASRGSLSSYAYTLMVIYFLQRCDPPVVPVLQELGLNNAVKKVMVEGSNTYFFEDMDKLEHVWPGYKKNTLAIGELWLQLLQYYTESFNFKIDVIAIRQQATLPRFEKLWNSKSIAIEDPFDLSHNLGAGLSRKMHLFIINALRRGRTLFGTPVELKLNNSLQSYFFDTNRLVDGVPPRDRCCKFCNKIGHLGKDCPLKNHTLSYEEIKKLETQFYERRRGPQENGNFNPNVRGVRAATTVRSRADRDREHSDRHRPGEEAAARGTGGRPNQQGYDRDQKDPIHSHYPTQNPGYNRQGVKHHGASSAQSWRSSPGGQQMQNYYLNYQGWNNDAMGRNYSPYHANQDVYSRQSLGSAQSNNAPMQGGGSGYKREDAQAALLAGLSRESQFAHHVHTSSSSFHTGRGSPRSDQYHSSNKNPGAYK